MIRAVVFDFDGTLADTVDIVMEGFLVIFGKYMGAKAPSREEIYTHFGMNEAGIIKKYMGDSVPGAEQEYYDIYNALLQKSGGAFAGVRELLEHLTEKKVMVGLITGKTDFTCNASLEHIGLKSFFSVLRYGSPVRINKDAQMREMLETFHLKPEEFVYVGDAVTDAEACFRAGVRCFSAAWAPCARVEQLQAVNPGFLFRTVDELRERIDRELP